MFKCPQTYELLARGRDQKAMEDREGHKLELLSPGYWGFREL